MGFLTPFFISGSIGLIVKILFVRGRMMELIFWLAADNFVEWRLVFVRGRMIKLIFTLYADKKSRFSGFFVRQ